jgi:hypothetical protein
MCRFLVIKRPSAVSLPKLLSRVRKTLDASDASPADRELLQRLLNTLDAASYVADEQQQETQPPPSESAQAVAGEAHLDASLVAWLRHADVAPYLLPACSKLGLRRLDELRHVSAAALRAVGVPPVPCNKFMAAVQRLKPVAAATATLAIAMPAAEAGDASAASQTPFEGKPFPEYTQASTAQFDAHAEELAASYMRYLGFADATRTGHTYKADSGVDVTSARAVAQVKAHVRGKGVARSALAQLVGDASVAAHRDKELLFFAVSFSADAQAFAQDGVTPRPIALFTFDTARSATDPVAPANDAARRLVAARACS